MIGQARIGWLAALVAHAMKQFRKETKDRVHEESLVAVKPPALPTPSKAGPVYERRSSRNCRPHRLCWLPVRRGRFVVQIDGAVYEPRPTGWRLIGHVGQVSFA